MKYPVFTKRTLYGGLKNINLRRRLVHEIRSGELEDGIFDYVHENRRNIMRRIEHKKSKKVKVKDIKLKRVSRFNLLEEE